jgi:hypothetical protein
MILNVEYLITVDDVFEFVDHFHLHDWFKSKYNLEQGDYRNYPIFDELVIEDVFVNVERFNNGYYFVVYNLDNDNFDIYFLPKQSLFEMCNSLNENNDKKVKNNTK